MIYGKDSKGNYPRLAKFARVFPIFPNYDNKRSMLHIDSLCELIKLTVEHQLAGLFYPQNKEYVRTSEMVKQIAQVHNKNIFMFRIFNPIIKLLVNKVLVIKKVFGSLYYDMDMSDMGKEYAIQDLKSTIELTESGK